MNTQKSIATFHELLTSGEDGSVLLTAIRKLTEVKDPRAIKKVAGPKPLGGWSGWPS
jgi:hypothetical protein